MTEPDVVAVVLNPDGGVKFVLTQYCDLDNNGIFIAADRLNADSLHSACWSRRPRQGFRLVVRFRRDADLERLGYVRSPAGVATFMDWADYEALAIMWKLSED